MEAEWQPASRSLNTDSRKSSHPEPAEIFSVLTEYISIIPYTQLQEDLEWQITRFKKASTHFNSSFKSIRCRGGFFFPSKIYSNTEKELTVSHPDFLKHTAHCLFKDNSICPPSLEKRMSPKLPFILKPQTRDSVFSKSRAHAPGRSWPWGHASGQRRSKPTTWRVPGARNARPCFVKRLAARGRSWGGSLARDRGPANRGRTERHGPPPPGAAAPRVRETGPRGAHRQDSLMETKCPPGFADLINDPKCLSATEPSLLLILQSPGNTQNSEAVWLLMF